MVTTFVVRNVNAGTCYTNAAHDCSSQVVKKERIIMDITGIEIGKCSMSLILIRDLREHANFTIMLRRYTVLFIHPNCFLRNRWIRFNFFQLI